MHVCSYLFLQRFLLEFMRILWMKFATKFFQTSIKQTAWRNSVASKTHKVCRCIIPACVRSSRAIKRHHKDNNSILKHEIDAANENLLSSDGEWQKCWHMDTRFVLKIFNSICIQTRDFIWIYEIFKLQLERTTNSVCPRLHKRRVIKVIILGKLIQHFGRERLWALSLFHKKIV